MAFELVEEVLNHAPAALDSAEMLVLVVIAEQARKVSRQANIRQDVFLHRCRQTESGLRKVFRRLKEHGLDVRVPLYVKADGRVMYAVPGVVPTYVLPPLPPPKSCPCDRCTKAVLTDLLQTEEVPQGASTGPQGGSTGPQGGSTSLGDPLSVPSPPPGGEGQGGQLLSFAPRRDTNTRQDPLHPSMQGVREQLRAASAKLHRKANTRTNAGMSNKPDTRETSTKVDET